MGDVEIVAVDDASTDGTADVLVRLAQEIPCLKVVRHDRNLGVGEARNTALSHALGDCVAWVDADDEVLDGWYSTIVGNVFQEGSAGLDVLVFGAEMAGHGRRWTMRHRPQPWKGTPQDMLEDMLLERGVGTWMWNVAFRRSLFDGVRFEGRALEDFRLMPSVVMRACRICSIPDMLYVYTRPDGSLTRGGDAEGYLDGLRMCLTPPPGVEGAPRRLQDVWREAVCLRCADYLRNMGRDVAVRSFLRRNAWRVLLDFRQGWRQKAKCVLGCL